MKTPGPGEYKTEQGQFLTKVRSKAATINPNLPRPDNFTKRPSYHVAPGSYKVEVRFGEDAKAHKISKSPIRVSATV